MYLSRGHACAVRLFVTRGLLEDALGDKSLEQAVNAATFLGGWACGRHARYASGIRLSHWRGRRD